MGKKIFLSFILLMLVFICASTVRADCASIKDGTILDSAGNVIQTGYDQFGYNYQAHKFNGDYDSSDRTIDGTYWGSTGDYVDDKLMMKWNNAWLSNKDCDGNNKPDRHFGHPSYIGSGAWLTNNVEGDYNDTEVAYFL